MIQSYITEILHILIPNHIGIVFVVFEKDRRIVIKVQIEQANIFSVSIIPQRKRLIPNFKHHIPMKSEKDLRRSVLSSLLDLLNHVFDLDMDIM